MRIATLILGATCALFSLTASAQVSAPSAEDIARAQAEATKAAIQMRGMTAERDSNGDVVRNQNGTLNRTQTSQVTKQNDLEYFKNITGLEGLEQVSSPGNKGRTGIVNVSTTQSFDLDCRTAAKGAIRSAGGLSFKFEGCTGSPVQSLTFSICDAQQRSSQCAADTDYSQRLEVPVGAFITVTSVQVGAGCNSVGVCRISAKGTQTIGGNDESLKQQAQSQAAQSGMVGDLRKNIESGQYAQKMTEVGRPLQDCAERNRQSMAANGTVSPCGDDGSNNSKVTVKATSQEAAQCNGPRQCVKEGTSSQSFTRSCTRTFPLTQQITNYSYDTAQCDISETTNADGTVMRSDSCVSGDTDKRTGLDKIGESAKQCTTTSDDGATCLAQKWTEYYASKDGKVTSTAGSPSEVAGACDNNPDNLSTTYQEGSWFGRTLSDAECAVVYDDGSVQQLTNANKPGCGIYTTPAVTRLCYGKPSDKDEADSCGSMDLQGCALTSSEPLSLSGNLVTSQKDTYQCQRQQTTCLQWSMGDGDNACLSADMALGTDKQKTLANDGSGMNAALVAAAIVDASAEGVDGDDSGNPYVPKIFTGTDMRCSRPTGGIGTLLSKNCCRIDLERPKQGNVIQDGCGMDTVKLAAARRSNYTVFIGEYCSKRMRFPRRCLQQTQTYCSFNGILPRLIHEQGRRQLDQMAASSLGADVQRQGLNYAYLDNAAGKWTTPVTVNGMQVAAWQWPNYCADSQKAGDVLAADPNAYECPGVVRTIIASCSNAGGCGSLPAAPEFGAGEWALTEIDPLEKQTSAISRFGVATGACSTVNGLCQYELAAWPIGQGGKAVVTRDLAWQLYLNEAPESTATGSLNQMSNVADLMFRTWSTKGLADGKTVPETIRIDFSRDGGQSWSTANVPTNLKNSEWTFPGSDVKISGSCDALTNLCAYRITGTTVVMAKPWGGAQNPDCTGFTAGQLSAMDFSKMDLSEWLSTVMDKASNVATSALAQAAATQLKDFNAQFQGGNGTIKVNSPVGANFARVTPSQGFGPFDVRLAASGYWPQTTGDKSVDTDIVTRVDVDWGDCTGNETLLHLDPASSGTGKAFNPNPVFNPNTGEFEPPRAAPPAGTGYVGTHRFEAPDKLKCGAARANVTQTIKLTAYTTKSGVQTRTLKVENAWAKFPGGNGAHNDTVGVTVTAPANGSNVPLPPKP